MASVLSVMFACFFSLFMTLCLLYASSEEFLLPLLYIYTHTLGVLVIKDSVVLLLWLLQPYAGQAVLIRLQRVNVDAKVQTVKIQNRI